MKPYVPHGGATVKCIAYRDDGAICKAPATVLDTQRGGMVCRAHAPAPDWRTRYAEQQAELLLRLGYRGDDEEVHG